MTSQALQEAKGLEQQQLFTDYRKKCLGSFATFAKFMQGPEYFSDVVHTDLCNFMQAVSECKRVYFDADKTIKHITPHAQKDVMPHGLILMPRGSYKSRFDRLFMIWRLLNYPGESFGLTTNTKDNGQGMLADLKREFESNEKFKALFPEAIPDNFKSGIWRRDAVAIKRTESSMHPSVRVFGVESQQTGIHYNHGIWDDTCAPDSSDFKDDIVFPSHERIQKAIGQYKSCTPILISPSKGIRFIVGTRWSYADLIAYIEENEPSFQIFDVSVYADSAKKKPRFKHLTMDDLKAVRVTYGDYMFSMLYENQKISPDSMTFKPEDLITLADLKREDIPEDSQYVITVDPADSTNRNSCDTAIVRVAYHRRKFYVDKVVSGKMSPLQVSEQVCDLAMEHPDRLIQVIVECQGGDATYLRIKDVMNDRKTSFPIRKMSALKRKEDRIANMQQFTQRHQIIFRPNQKELLQQLEYFPHHPKNDIADALSMHLEVMHQQKEFGIDHQSEIDLGISQRREKTENYSANHLAELAEQRMNGYGKYRFGGWGLGVAA